MNPEKPNNVSSFDKVKKQMKWKRFLAKKWFFPAIYLLAAALIISVAWWYQGTQTKEVNQSLKGEKDTILPVERPPGNPTDDDMILPIAKGAAQKTVTYYEEASPQQQREDSIVKYANSYWPHAGVDFARKDGKSFDVLAALDGKVIRVEKNPIVGMQVEIQHESGLITVYQSLEDVRVKEGQMVKKGDILAKAGRNQFEKEAGNHLHFEIRKGKQAVNPEQYLKNAK
ncbi:M23 family metallopeptidase [Thermoflavimicrobium dichotomicum]|uniref:Stage II sporulation protein Q n=1 Tax=Thermoflavimicrobium dichotomicum TaxID=46223 RepID=A0A1I3K0C9_9BACL|nr:M23 family metallopeptidase [Thermoflavimicrobium dichotomicum]SFI65967.1 stage II sporulation protein Q [Thermoflavimicrobium dichotomicum]